MNDLKLNEAVLNTWVRFEGIMRMTVMNGTLTHREFGVCNMIANSDEPITATDLCEKLAIDKSQMNRTLTKLEQSGIIIRERSADDRRRVYIGLNTENIGAYENMHKRAIDYTNAVISKLGAEHIREIRKAFIEVISTLEEVTSPR